MDLVWVSDKSETSINAHLHEFQVYIEKQKKGTWEAQANDDLKDLNQIHVVPGIKRLNHIAGVTLYCQAAGGANNNWNIVNITKMRTKVRIV